MSTGSPSRAPFLAETNARLEVDARIELAAPLCPRGGADNINGVKIVY